MGHLLIRPLLPLLSYAVGANPTIATTLLLAVVSSLATLVAALLLYAILFEEIANPGISLFLSVVFLCANTNLYGLHSGTSNSAELACLMGALWCAKRESRCGDMRLLHVCQALAVGFWLPYVVSFPALLCSGH